MYVQVIEGNVSDIGGLRTQMETWATDLQPGATGYLGSTVGLLSNGRAIVFARFDSPESALANSQRPEQGQWWADTEKHLQGEVSFVESTDVDILMGGGSDDAGFVQIMKDSSGDRERLQAMDLLFDEYAADFRPDLLGGIRVWTGATAYIEAAYFTSEAEARKNEQNEPPPGFAEDFGDFIEMMSTVEFLSITDPNIFSA